LLPEGNPMRVALWDSHRHTVEDDFGGGDSLPGRTLLGSLYNWTAHQVFPLDRHPPPLEMACLAAVLRRLQHTVEYVEDDAPLGDVILLRPSLATVGAALKTIDQARRRLPKVRVLVVGPTASRWPHWFTQRGATVLKGDVEQLASTFEQVLACDRTVVHLGCLEDLDIIPWPEWSWFEPDRFRLPRHCRAFPVGRVQHSYAGGEKQPLRYRSAERVVSELRHQIESCGFEAFVFGDPRFAAHRQQACRLVQLLSRLPQRIEFSIHCQPEDINHDLLAALADVGLSTAAFTIDVTNEACIAEDCVAAHAGFVSRCQKHGIRTLVSFCWHGATPPARPQPIVDRAACQIGATLTDFRWRPPKDLSLDQLRRFSLGWVNRYYLRFGYAWQQCRLLAAGNDAAPFSTQSDMPHADAAHPDTPKPLGGLDLIQRTRGLRKDAPHQRTSTRRNQLPPSRHE
jgi:hypothetical protein